MNSHFKYLIITLTVLSLAVWNNFRLPFTHATNQTPTKGDTVKYNNQPQSLPPLDTVDFISKQIGWAGGKIILATHDGGLHWNVQYRGSTEITQIVFVDRHHGYAVAKNQLLLYTRNGGASWIPVSSNILPASIDFLTPKIGWGIWQGSLVKTIDGGRMWTKISTGILSSSVSFISLKTGYIAGNDQVVKTTDGGLHWDTQFHAPVSHLLQWNPQILAKGNSVWVQFVGNSGAASQQPYVIFHSSNGGSHWQASLAEESFPTLYPTVKGLPYVDAYAGPLDVVNASTAYFFGTCPACYGWGTSSFVRTTNSGHSFSGSVVSGVFGPEQVDASFVNVKDGWMVSTNLLGQGEILTTSDGGKEWIAQDPMSVGPAPNKVSQDTIKKLALSNLPNVPGVVSPTSFWVDGLVKNKSGHWTPLYVWSDMQSQAIGQRQSPYIQVSTANINDFSHFAFYACPQNIGPIHITGFSKNGMLLYFEGKKGANGSLNLANHSWIISHSPHTT